MLKRRFSFPRRRVHQVSLDEIPLDGPEQAKIERPPSRPPGVLVVSWILGFLLLLVMILGVLSWYVRGELVDQPQRVLLFLKAWLP